MAHASLSESVELRAYARALHHLHRGLAAAARDPRVRAGAVQAGRAFAAAWQQGMTRAQLAAWFERARGIYDAVQAEHVKRYVGSGDPQVGFDLIEFWTPAQALARIEHLDAKIAILDRAITGSPDAAFRAAWQDWRGKWIGFRDDLRGSWFARGFVGVAKQLDAYAAEHDKWRADAERRGTVIHAPQLPEPEPSHGGVALPAALGALAAFGAAWYFGRRKR